MTEKDFFDILLAILFALAGITFISLFFVSAPYGRYSRKGWGPQVNAKAAWVVQELPSVVLFAWFFFLGQNSYKVVPVLFLILWQIHYVHRTFIYPFSIRGNKKATFATLILAFIFTSLNSYINARWLSHFSSIYSLGWLVDPRFIAGVILFVLGFAMNRHSDWILKNLRKPGENEYTIPQGGMFKFVSAANYLGEIIEWSGWALATWSLPGLCFAVFTFANLAPRALSHHKWYKEKFPDYPKDRKALIPFVI